MLPSQQGYLPTFRRALIMIDHADRNNMPYPADAYETVVRETSWNGIAVSQNQTQHYILEHYFHRRALNEIDIYVPSLAAIHPDHLARSIYNDNAIHILCDERPDKQAPQYQMLRDYDLTTGRGRITQATPDSRDALREARDDNALVYFSVSDQKSVYLRNPSIYKAGTMVALFNAIHNAPSFDDDFKRATFYGQPVY